MKPTWWARGGGWRPSMWAPLNIWPQISIFGHYLTPQKRENLSTQSLTETKKAYLIYTQGLRRKSSVHDVTKVATNINTIFANLMQVNGQHNTSPPHTITTCQRHGQSTRFLFSYKLQIFLGPMLILFCPKMSAVRTRLNRTGCVKNKHCRCEIKGRSMEISSWNSFSDLRLLTSIMLTTDLT